MSMRAGSFEIGRVQITKHGQWGGVCGTGFTHSAATVVCKELGYNYGKVSLSDKTEYERKYLDEIKWNVSLE